MASNSQAAKQCVCISTDVAVLIQIQNLRSMVLSSLLLSNHNSSESFSTISSHSFHTFVTSKKSVWCCWTFSVLLFTLPGEPTSRPCYIFIDRLFVLNSTMAALCMVPRENRTYVYSITYRTMHSWVPSERHLPLGCVFKPRNLHSTYCMYSLRLGSSPINPAYNTVLSPKFKASFSSKPNQIPIFGIRIAPDLEKIGSNRNTSSHSSMADKTPCNRLHSSFLQIKPSLLQRFLKLDFTNCAIA